MSMFHFLAAPSADYEPPVIFLLFGLAISLVGSFISGLVLLACLRVLDGGEIREPKTVLERISLRVMNYLMRKSWGNYTQHQMARMWILISPLMVLMSLWSTLMFVLGMFGLMP